LQFPTKKLFRGRRNRGNNWFAPAESGCSGEQKTLGIPFRTIPQRRKNARNSVPWNKNRSKLSEFRSEPFRGTENSWNSVPNSSTEEKNARNYIRKHVSDKNMLSILFAGAGFFVKLIFFITFSSISILGIDSSVNLGMLRNEHFLPRNNGSHSDSIPRNLFGTKFRCQPYHRVHMA
jgi:hypothetical protein